MSFEKDSHGNKALAEGKQLESKQDALLQKTDPGIALPGQTALEHEGIGGRYFPVTPDESARVFEKKNQILQQTGIGKGWQAQITDADAQRLIRQEQRLADAQYENWIAENFVKNMDNPSDQAWAQRIVPEYFNKRKQVIEDYTEIQKKIAMMELTGPQNEEDLKLLYMWNSGLIEIPREAVHRMKAPSNVGEQFKRGRFNVRRNTANPVDYYGITTDTFVRPDQQSANKFGQNQKGSSAWAANLKGAGSNIIGM